MTTLTIELPDALARRAEKTGLLQSSELLRLIERAVTAIEKEQDISLKLKKSGPFTVFAPEGKARTVSAEEIQALIDDEGIL